ncbi:hypothetical protein VTN77DRAFT_3579 [Rasamsonia byssochlamydoides]|uniref:uncharacterized protein n=1 Tax=Rasamsonia byssochlamydoides TaxID=89139 RepID=UPI003744A0EA
MTDLTPSINELLRERHAAAAVIPDRHASTETVVDEFLKEAYRINSHINSLLRYLQSIRHSYLSIATAPAVSSTTTSTYSSRRTLSTSTTSTTHSTQPHTKHLTDQDRDSIDSSTALLLRDLSSSISNLSSAESLRQETEASLLRKKYGHANSAIWRWASGGGAALQAKTPEQERDEETARTIRTVRESVLWYLRRGLEAAAEAQRGMVEKRIERVREREKSVLYKAAAATAAAATPASGGAPAGGDAAGAGAVHDTALTMADSEVADIESQLSPEQLQLFEEENDAMLKHYEDTLSKVKNAEKSLLEISSLQQTLVSHLATQEEYINQLVTDAATTAENVSHANKELQRATERRSTAQMVFWGTVGLCTGLVVWDAIF